MRSMLEHQPQRELDLPRGRGRRRNLAGRVANAVVGAVALPNDPIRVREIRMIENIEHFRAELQIHAFPDGNPLEQGRVDVKQARATERTPSRVAVGARSRHREGTGIEPAVHSARNYLPLKVWIQVGYVDGSSVAAAGIIEADQRRKGEAALSVEDPIPLPAPNQMVHPAGCATAKVLPVSERQLIAEVRVELVFDAVGSHASVPLAIVGTQEVRRLILA